MYNAVMRRASGLLLIVSELFVLVSRVNAQRPCALVVLGGGATNDAVVAPALPLAGSAPAIVARQASPEPTAGGLLVDLAR
jgi:hypothetical protein